MKSEIQNPKSEMILNRENPTSFGRRGFDFGFQILTFLRISDFDVWIN